MHDLALRLRKEYSVNVPLYPLVDSNDMEYASVLITRVVSKFPLLGHILENVVWNGENNSQVIEITQFLLDESHYMFACVLDQDAYLVSLQEGGWFDESDRQVAFFIWATTHPAVPELLSAHSPKDLLNYLHFIHLQPVPATTTTDDHAG